MQKLNAGKNGKLLICTAKNKQCDPFTKGQMSILKKVKLIKF